MDQRKDFDLIENAKESLEHAVDHLTRKVPPTPNDLKRAILDISHVIELLLKEAIQRIHPAFIWEKVDEYPNGEKRMVGAEMALQRLIKIGGVQFKEETIDGIKKTRTLRNKIEHYKFAIEEDATRLLMGKLLSLIFDFSSRGLLLNWEEEFRHDSKWKILIQDMDFWRAHGPVVEVRIVREGKPVFACTACNAETFDLVACECELCGHRESVEKCASCGDRFPVSILDDYGDPDSGPVFLCGACFDRHFG